jgi:hypothetical protein
VRPATFRELAAAQARVTRALKGLPPEDQVRVLEATHDEVQAGPAYAPERGTAPQCEANGASGARCVIYAGHTGAHDFKPIPGIHPEPQS